MPNVLSDILNQPLLMRIRRNHGLEHATIHMLSSKYPRTQIAGRADANGFYILGHLPTDAIAESAEEAAARLRNGEGHLAIHPNCGTNFLTAGVLAGLAAFAALLGGRTDRTRDRLERLPFAILATVAALIIAQPIGSAAQRHVTTTSDIGNLRIGDIHRVRRGRTTVHRIRTRG